MTPQPQPPAADSPFARLRRLRRDLHDRRPVLVEFALFGMVGASGFVVDVALFLGVQFAFGLHHQVARALSFWGSATWNWAWNRGITFAGRKRTRKRFQWPAFLLSSLLGFVVNWGTYYTLTNHVAWFRSEGARIPALLVGVIAGMGLNFVVARSFVFAHKPVPRDPDFGPDALVPPRPREAGRRHA
ncbi:MAG: GtrA family protein [Planctomycetes bacterium]|nr:GtrA family protein [Planctomycetota bacterium]MCB9870160.1 GtrA family protein [Planctomycetota bacterium]